MVFIWYYFIEKVVGGRTLLGEMLKKKRDDLGLDLREIANTLKIRYDYLKAIEDENFKLLPAEVYLKGYILEYAKLLNIEEDTVLKAYEEDQFKFKKNKLDEVKFHPRKKPNIKILIISSVLSLFLIFLVITFLVPTKQNTDNSSEKLDKIDNSGIQILKPDLNTPLSKEKLTNESMMPEESSQQILEIIATDTTWILANIDGTDLKEVLMKPGESVKWHARKSFSLKIGNAGGVRLNLNGKELEKLGEIGQVVSIDLPDDNKNM